MGSGPSRAELQGHIDRQNELTKKLAEQARRAEEQTRQAKEQARKSGEQARRAEEQARQAAEETRRAEEQARQAVKETRQAEEQAREAVEETRQAEEQARQAAEETRQAEEQARQAQEQARQAEEQARQALEETRQAGEQARKATEHLAQAQSERWQRLSRSYAMPDFLKSSVNVSENEDEANAAGGRFVNVAMVGDSETGKSALIQMVLKQLGVDMPDDKMEVNVADQLEVNVEDQSNGRRLPSKFPLTKFGERVFLWHFPSQETPEIPPLAHHCNMGIMYFDVVCIVTDGRWSHDDHKLLAAIYNEGIRCFLLRSKVDYAVAEGKEKDWSTEQTLSHVRQQLQDPTGLKPHRIHLLTSKERYWNVFGSVNQFCRELQKDVNDVKASKPTEDLFEKEPQRPQTSEQWVEYLRYDAGHQCFKSVGSRKRKAVA